jgi:hypothetical protein
LPKTRDRTGIIVIFLSLVYCIAISFIYTNDLIWRRLSTDVFVVWLAFLIALIGAAGGIVATYSFLYYSQQKKARDLVCSLMTSDVVIVAFLFLLSHPVFQVLGPFFSRERNRTLVTALGFVLTPGVLIGSFAGDKKLSKTEFRLVILIWLVIAPILYTWLFLSPEPVFIVTTPEGGLLGLTLIGLVNTIVVGVSAFGSLVRYTIEWYHKGGRELFGWILALVFWIFSFFIYAILNDPLQVAELVWIGSMFCGFSIVAVTMAMSSIIEPHKALEELVEERTSQLKESRQESVFYLRLWTHKMGNLLQSLITYLQLIENRISAGESVADIETSAIEVSREAALVNRQVAKLYQIKESSESQLWPVALKEIITRSINESKNLLTDRGLSTQISDIPSDLMVQADGLLDVVFVNLFIRCRLQSKDEASTAKVDVQPSGDSVRISIQCPGIPLSSEIMKSFNDTSTLLRSTLDLDLIMVRMLIDKYRGAIQYTLLPNPDRNLFVILFNKG